MYPSMLSRAPDIENEPYYCLPVSAQSAVPWSQPTSPTPPTRGFTGLLSPSHNASHRLTYPKKNDEGNLANVEVEDAALSCHDANEKILSFSPLISVSSAWQSNLPHVGRILNVWFNNGRATTGK